ncbi:beta-1,3-galactosyltransferase 1-like [Plakobranchus ocellatus]|uniref:Beta-1,3-galactosyltransferase 1-like n=1 Tax=Plakobranchus ocellatus TaxID=259542 RepID=A0AAV3Z2W9_9GAST|nr:beta-1,3-galactosyltransferase 1-like [Plakobranchus ocellatus]
MFPRPTRVTRWTVLIVAIFGCAAFFYHLTPALIQSSGGRGFEASRFTTARIVRENTTKAVVSNKYKEVYKAYKAVLSEPPRSVNPHDFRYIHNPSDLCRGRLRGHPKAGGDSREQSQGYSFTPGGEKRPVTLLIYVHSAPVNLKKRQAIRQTWAHPTLLRRLDAAVVFLLGRPGAVKEQDLLDLEANEYGDLVQEDYLDAYRNLTYKGVAGLRWVTLFCPSAVFILKTDDDILVDIESLVADLRKRYPGYPPLSSDPAAGKTAPAQSAKLPSRVVLCNLWTRMKVMRDPKSKWFIPASEFAPDFFPPYCSGSAFILSADLAPKLYLTSLDAPFFWVDDYYVTGVLVNKLGVPHTRYNHAYLLNANLAESRLVNDTKQTLIFHIKKLSLFLKVWPLLMKRHMNIPEFRWLAPTTHSTPSSIVGVAPTHGPVKSRDAPGAREADVKKSITRLLTSKTPQHQGSLSKLIVAQSKAEIKNASSFIPNVAGKAKNVAPGVPILRDIAGPQKLSNLTSSQGNKQSPKQANLEPSGKLEAKAPEVKEKIATVIVGKRYKIKNPNGIDMSQEAVQKVYSIPADSKLIGTSWKSRPSKEKVDTSLHNKASKPSDQIESKLHRSMEEEQNKKTRLKAQNLSR